MALLQARSVRESQLDEVKSKFCRETGERSKVAVVAVAARGSEGSGDLVVCAGFSGAPGSGYL